MLEHYVRGRCLPLSRSTQRLAGPLQHSDHRHNAAHVRRVTCRASQSAVAAARPSPLPSEPASRDVAQPSTAACNRSAIAAHNGTVEVNGPARDEGGRRAWPDEHPRRSATDAGHDVAEPADVAGAPASPGSPVALRVPRDRAGRSGGGGGGGGGNRAGRGGRASGTNPSGGVTGGGQRPNRTQQGPVKRGTGPTSPNRPAPPGPPGPASAPAASPPPAPPPPQDHSTGGFTLVSTPAELELMLDQLVAAARAVASGTSSSSSSSNSSNSSGGGNTNIFQLCGSASGGGSTGGGGGGAVGPLAVDCEGAELGRPGGKLCLLQLSARIGGGGRSGGGGSGRGGVSIWLVDVQALGWRAFQYRSRLDGATSLKGLLEDPAVVKYLYDVRRDAEALSSEYGVRLRGVVDLQLADVAVRQAQGGLRAGGWVEGLVSALSRGLASGGRASAPPRLADDLAAATSTSRRYHESNNTQVWSRRPLTPELCEYAATDVRYLHALADALSPRLSRELAERVVQESFRRTVTPMPNSKDLRAAAPVMISRQQPASAGGGAAGASGAAAAPGAERAGGRGGPGARPATAGAGGVGRDAAPFMGLMEWLTAALLLRYDQYDKVAEPSSAPRLWRSAAAAAAAVGGLTAAQPPATGQSSVAPPPPQRRPVDLPGSAPREEEMRAAVTTAAAGAGPPAAAAAAVGAGDDAAAGGCLESGLLSVAMAPRCGPGFEPGPGPADRGGSTAERNTAGAPVSGWPLQSAVAPGVETATPTQPATATATARSLPGDYPAVSTDNRSQLPSTVARPGPGAAAVGRTVSTAPEHSMTALGSSARGEAGTAGLAVGTGPVSMNGPAAVGVRQGAAPVGSESLRPLAPATEPVAAPLTSRSQQLQPPPQAPAPAPLLVPSMETFVWAEQQLSQLWLDLRSTYGYVDPEEDRKLARLAARWLVASHRGIQSSVGRTSGRRDPGLRWLLQD